MRAWAGVGVEIGLSAWAVVGVETGAWAGVEFEMGTWPGFGAGKLGRIGFGAAGAWPGQSGVAEGVGWVGIENVAEVEPAGSGAGLGAGLEGGEAVTGVFETGPGDDCGLGAGCVGAVTGAGAADAWLGMTEVLGIEAGSGADWETGSGDVEDGFGVAGVAGEENAEVQLGIGVEPGSGVESWTGVWEELVGCAVAAGWPAGAWSGDPPQAWAAWKALDV